MTVVISLVQGFGGKSAAFWNSAVFSKIRRWRNKMVEESSQQQQRRGVTDREWKANKSSLLRGINLIKLLTKLWLRDPQLKKFFLWQSFDRLILTYICKRVIFRPMRCNDGLQCFASWCKATLLIYFWTLEGAKETRRSCFCLAHKIKNLLKINGNLNQGKPRKIDRLIGELSSHLGQCFKSDPN